jgi:hypothetical protein
MRYLVRPLFEHANDTGRFIGSILVGDMTNGKTPITYLVTHGYGTGFSGLYTRKGLVNRVTHVTHGAGADPDVTRAVLGPTTPPSSAKAAGYPTAVMVSNGRGPHRASPCRTPAHR